MRLMVRVLQGLSLFLSPSLSCLSACPLRQGKILLGKAGERDFEDKLKKEGKGEKGGGEGKVPSTKRMGLSRVRIARLVRSLSWRQRMPPFRARGEEYSLSRSKGDVVASTEATQSVHWMHNQEHSMLKIGDLSAIGERILVGGTRPESHKQKVGFLTIQKGKKSPPLPFYFSIVLLIITHDTSHQSRSLSGLVGHLCGRQCGVRPREDTTIPSGTLSYSLGGGGGRWWPYNVPHGFTQLPLGSITLLPGLFLVLLPLHPFLVPPEAPRPLSFCAYV